MNIKKYEFISLKKHEFYVKINNNIKRGKIGLRKANISRNLKVFRNAQKSLGPIILSQITNILVRIFSDNGKLLDLVNKTNEINNLGYGPK